MPVFCSLCFTFKYISGCLKSRTTPDQAEYYWRLVEKREAADARAENNRSMLDHTNVFLDDEVRLPLDDCKRQILKNLQVKFDDATFYFEGNFLMRVIL
jgi:hypothetical protein